MGDDLFFSRPALHNVRGPRTLPCAVNDSGDVGRGLLWCVLVDYFKVKSWDDYQHYRDRTPTWIKLHTNLPDDYAYAGLDDQGKLLWFTVMILAAKTKNKIPLDPDWIAHRGCLKTPPNLDPLFDCGFIVRLHASKSLASCSDHMETEREEKKDKKKEPDDQKVVSETRLRSIREEGMRAIGRVPK